MNKSSLLTIVGFIFFILGFLSIILYLVGVKLSILLWMDYWGAGIGLILRIVMLLLGFILTFISKSVEFE